MIKKKLKKIFKKISYSFFILLYGKIKSSLKTYDNNKIEKKSLKLEKDLTYNIYKVTNGRLYTDRIQDTAILLDNKVVDGPSFQMRHTQDSKVYMDKVENNIVFKIGTPRILKKVNGKVLSLLTGGGGNSNYWHWLLDVLPRLNLCQKYINLDRIDFFLLPSLERHFQNETLDLLNIPKSKRISSEKFRHIKADELLATDHPVVTSGDATKDIQKVPEWIIPWLQKSFIKKEFNNEKKNKIYIDRDELNLSKKPIRYIQNEEDVRKFLTENNFIFLNLEKMKFIDQVKMFYNAECVVGLHGAGLANLAFCRPESKVVELRSSGAGPVCENYGKSNKLNYFSLISEAKKLTNQNFKNQQGSIEVSINSLNKILNN